MKLRLKHLFGPALALLLLALLPAAAAAEGRCGNPAQRPWCETSLSAAKRADLLLGADDAGREDLAARR